MNALPRLFVAALIAALPLLGGCQNTATVRSEAKMTASQFRANLNKVNPQIERTVGDLTKLQAGDTTAHGAAFAQFQTDLKILEELVAPLRYQSDRLRREGFDYFKAWSEEMVLADSSADRSKLEAGRAKSDERYKRFMEYLDNAAGDFRQLYYELKDVEEYLAADPSTKNIAVQKPVIDEAIARSMRVKGRIDTLSNEIAAWVKGQ